MRTANEIHIPDRTSVNVVVHSADVIHSFWVPQLNRKIDTIPGRTNRVELYADEAGRVPRSVRGVLRPAARPHGVPRLRRTRGRLPTLARRRGRSRPHRRDCSSEAQLGKRYFMENACAGCHTIRGTQAEGTIGPDLTHVAGRDTIAA